MIELFSELSEERRQVILNNLLEIMKANPDPVTCTSKFAQYAKTLPTEEEQNYCDFTVHTILMYDDKGVKE